MMYVEDAVKKGNRYTRMRNHKRIAQKKWIINWSWRFGSSRDFSVIENRYYTEPYRSKLKYWKLYYVSGSRKLAKMSTNRKIRQRFRDMPIDEDTTACRNSDYRRTEDYWWIVW